MKTFLIADDSPDKILMLRHFLKVAKWDGQIVTAATCEEAYRVIDANPGISAAFIDYYIPADNGPAIIAYLKKSNPSARVALVSSAENEENSARARAQGAEAVVCSTHRSDLVERQILDLLQEWQADQR